MSFRVRRDAWDLTLELQINGRRAMDYRVIEVMFSIWIVSVLCMSPRLAKSPEDEYQCRDLALYVELTVVYYIIGFVFLGCVFMGAKASCLAVPLAIVLIAGYILVGGGALILVEHYEYRRGLCSPVLFYTATFITIFRALQTNLLECRFVVNFFRAADVEA
eukprot:CAMPEP_0178420248 /NCGR_PEP_ID=MMETSP0689_2-20121128/26030_1 /TAXON_ID=160604 /ORGANISM="Amphidinium massartii, Strain CS-259" /LENGTH=161 /DNA_ID=CAMNT_0020041715 /DNA_START=46 /DNA_END=529 /DNA_ORIENTATION=-